MGLMNALNRLDQTVVPRLARGLRRIGWLTRRWRVNPLAVLAVILVAAVITTITWPIIRNSPSDAGSRSTVPVGVGEGESIARYIEDSRAELDQLAADQSAPAVYALVTFSSYLPPSRVAAVAATTGPDVLTTISAYARVPVPRRQTERVRLSANRLPDDLLTSMIEVADEKDDEASAHRDRARVESDADLRTLYESMASLEAAEASAYRAACACVFALVVRAAPTVLQDLAGHGDVRVVDAAQDVTRLDLAVFLPPQPEQAGVAGPVPDDELVSPRRPVPWPSSDRNDLAGGGKPSSSP